MLRPTKPEVEKPSVEERSRDMALAAMKISALKRRARADGISEADIRQALDAADPKAATIDLIVAHERSTRLSASAALTTAPADRVARLHRGTQRISPPIASSLSNYLELLTEPARG